MRRNNNKQNDKSHASSIKRVHSHAHFTLTQNKTLAQINHPSSRHHTSSYHPSHPVRVLLPDYFNVPKFADADLFGQHSKLLEQQLFNKMRSEAELKRKLKDLNVLAEGMRRAKNIKEQSRYYFIQGVLQHNCGAYSDSITSLQKFLKIVLFIRDQKSVELALNSIGAGYMSIGNHQKAFQYHKKQGEINERADGFLSRINCGMCYEMAGDWDSALAEYQQAQNISKLDIVSTRRTFTEKLKSRIMQKKSDVFITAERKEELNESLVDQSILPLNKAKTMKSKIIFAIKSAEQHLDRYLDCMKNSFVLEKE